MTLPSQVLDHVGQLSDAQIEALPTAEIGELLVAIAECKDAARDYEGALQAALDRRCGVRAREMRAAEGKPAGTVRFELDGCVVIADLPKRPEYDQAKLRAAVETLVRGGENPEDYVSFEIKVSENRYNAWPPAVRQIFEPARTLKVGRPSYRIEARARPKASARDGLVGEVA